LDELEILEIKNHNSYHDGLNSTEGGNIGHRNAMEARKRFNKILKNKREREVKQKAKQERRALTNFEKNLEKDIKTFQKESRNKNSYKDLQEHVNRTIGGTKRPSIQSQYVGVCWDTGNKKWRAAIKHQGKKIYIGLFGD